MSTARFSPRNLVLAVVLAVAVAFIGWKVSHLLADPSIFPPDDFVEYWAAGQLNATGQDPYDGALLLPLEREAGRDTDEPIMMWNPPWTLTLAMPIGMLKARIAQFVWLAISFALIVGCADRLWALYGGATSLRWVSWLLSLTFIPSLFVLQAGQIGPFILLGITGFLLAERANRYWLAGACGVLMAIKPHLVYLFWIALAEWAVRRPMPDRWKVIGGGLACGVFATTIPLACNSQVIAQYLDAMTNRPPDQWKSPTIGSLLREVFGETQFALQFVPTVIGIGWLAVHGWQTRYRAWNWADEMPMLLLVSFATASYGAWPFDLVILLPAVIHIAAGLASLRAPRPAMQRFATAIAVFVTINGGALAMNLLHVTSDRFVWMAPSLLVAYVTLRPRPAIA
jgi:Glycosyltransferase family 87